MIRLLLVFLLLYNTTLGQDYLLSYVKTVDKQEFAEKSISCRSVKEVPDITGNFVVKDYDAEYAFRALVISHDEPTGNISGYADCGGIPYSLRRIDKHGRFIIWILPLKFNKNSTFSARRSFIYTNDAKLIQDICPGAK